MNIRVDLNTSIKDGTEVVFRSPVDCSQVTGLKVYYRGSDGNTASQVFVLADAHGNNVGDIDHLFAENVAVKVILDVTTGMAFVQNADTNAYLEGRFEALEKKISTGGGLTDTARILLMTVLRNGVYTSDQSANLAALEEALKTSGGGGFDEPDVPDVPDVPAEPKTYTITNALTNCTNSNSATSIEENSAYTAVISAVDGYELQSVIVTMGGSAVTVMNGVISISKVTGNIVITAVATAVATETVEEVLAPLWISGKIDATTYEHGGLKDQSGGHSGSPVYAQSVTYVQSETDGGVVHIDLDTSKLSKCRFRLYMWDSEGNPYKNSAGCENTEFGGEANPASGDLSNIPLNSPGAVVGYVTVNGSFTYNIPAGCKVMIDMNFAAENIVDETLNSATKPLYALVDAITFNGEVLTAKIVKEV